MGYFVLAPWSFWVLYRVLDLKSPTRASKVPSVMKRAWKVTDGSMRLLSHVSFQTSFGMRVGFCFYVLF